MTNLFFTYGTLMTGERNNHVIPKRAVKKTEKAYVKGVMFAVRSGSFPCLLPTFEDNIVVGELFTIKDEYLEDATESMDMLEGFIRPNNPNNFYNRILVPVTKENGDVVEAWVYFFNRGRDYIGERIESNDWKIFRELQLELVEEESY